MKFTRVKTTLMAGVMAASMVAPGMTAFAVDQTPKGLNTSSANAADELKINKVVQVAKGVTIPGTISFKVERYDHNSTTNQYENADGTIQPDTSDWQDKTYSIYGDGVENLKDGLNDNTYLVPSTDKANYAENGANKKASTDSILPDLQKACQTNGEYTFKISETSPTVKGNNDEYGWSVVDGSVYYLHVYVTTGNDGKTKNYQYLATKQQSNQTTESYDSTKKKYSGKVASLDFNNTFTKRAGKDTENDSSNDPKKGASLVVEKQVVDSQGNAAAYEASGAEYTFKVKLTSSNTYTITNGTTQFSYKIYQKATTASGTDSVVSYEEGGETKQEHTATVGSDGNISITLKSGQYAVFSDIPAGVTAKVEENDPAASLNIDSTKVTAKGDGAIVNSKDDVVSKDSGSFILGEKENSVLFKNVYKDVTVTGVVTNIAPYITLVVVAAAAVAAYMGIKNRIAR